jgi:hypothetical protein
MVWEPACSRRGGGACRRRESNHTNKPLHRLQAGFYIRTGALVLKPLRRRSIRLQVLAKPQTHRPHVIGLPSLPLANDKRK